MIRTELKRVFKTWIFWGACVIVLFCFVYASDFEFQYLAGWGHLSEGIWQEKFVELTGLGDGELAGLLCPILVMLPYALSYRKERDSGYRQLMVLKSSPGAYRRTKLLTTGVSGATLMCLPYLCWMPVCFMLGTKVVDPHGNVIRNLAPVLLPMFENYPTLYVVLYLINVALVGAMHALLGLGVSAVVRNKYLAVLFPFGYCLFSAIVLEHISHQLEAFYLISLGFGPCWSISGHIGYLLFLFALGIVLFIGGDCYAEKA